MNGSDEYEFTCLRCFKTFDFKDEVEEHLVYNHDVLIENYRVEDRRNEEPL